MTRLSFPPDARLDSFLIELGAAGVVSAAAALVGSAETVLAAAQWGTTQVRGGVAVTPETLFDLASLTKPFMASLALSLHQEGLVPLELAIGEIWPEADPRLARRPVADLLRHRAGFQAWTPLYRRCSQRAAVAELLVSGALLSETTGTYSDLDFILWGLSVERVLDGELGEILDVYVGGLAPAQSVVSSPGPPHAVAACYLGNEREVELAASQGFELAAAPAPPVGTPQDGNARFMKGLAGHAGLFASAVAVWSLARSWLEPGGVWPTDAVAAALDGSEPYVLGWWKPPASISTGPYLSTQSFGHTGFTGGSVWVDPEARRILVLLAHRASLRCDLNPWRRRFHELGLEI
jgi:CubicO group peptidase (beta-lactamase class C family)